MWSSTLSDVNRLLNFFSKCFLVFINNVPTLGQYYWVKSCLLVTEVDHSDKFVYLEPNIYKANTRLFMTQYGKFLVN